MNTLELREYLEAFMAKPPRMAKGINMAGETVEVDLDKCAAIRADKLLESMNDARRRAMIVFPLPE